MRNRLLAPWPERWAEVGSWRQRVDLFAPLFAPGPQAANLAAGAADDICFAWPLMLCAFAADAVPSRDCRVLEFGRSLSC